ncbi:unnamed protein product [Trichobilharzia regenti]|nr:unnamed protein product [Trichobilharzia regenti]
MTALHLASLSGNLEAVDLFLQAGASPNLVVRRPAGLPPLEGCDSEILGSVFTPLHLAVHRAHPDIVCILLCHGARAGCRSGAGRSPMQLALTALAENEELQQRLDIITINDDVLNKYDSYIYSQNSMGHTKIDQSSNEKNM